MDLHLRLALDDETRAAAADAWADAERARLGRPAPSEYLAAQRDGFLDVLRRPDAWLLVAEEAEGQPDVVGLVGGFPADEADAGGPNAGYVAWVGVREASWGRGVGRRLLDAAAAEAARAGWSSLVLWVHTDNGRARRLYEAAGWRPTGRAMLTPGDEEELQQYRLDLG